MAFGPETIELCEMKVQRRELEVVTNCVPSGNFILCARKIQTKMSPRVSFSSENEVVSKYDAEQCTFLHFCRVSQGKTEHILMESPG